MKNLSCSGKGVWIKGSIVLFLMLGFFFAGPIGIGHAADEVKLGIVTGLTGPGAPWGKRAWNTAQLLLDELNAKGGIKSMGGATIKYVVMDHQTKPDIAGSNTEKLIRDGVSAIIGCNNSDSAMVASQVCQRAKIPYIDNNDHDPMLTERGFDYVFRVCHSGTQLGDGTLEFAQWLAKMGGKAPTKVGIVCCQSAAPYATFKEWEVSIPKVYNVVFKQSYPVAQQDYSGIVSNMKKLGVDFVFQMAYPADAILLTRTFKELDFNPMAFLADDSGHDVLDYIKAVGKDADYLFCTTTYTPDLKIPLLEELRAKYMSRFGVEFDRADALMANAVSVFVDAVERAGSGNPAKLREALKATNLSVGQYWYVVPDGCKFNEKNQNVKQKLMTFQIRDGKWRTVHPQELAVEKPVYPIPPWNKR